MFTNLMLFIPPGSVNEYYFKSTHSIIKNTTAQRPLPTFISLETP